ncbi:hypothetical protein M885DRAFT_139860 [Pelagophyceae sp. CCMP2097]|nr:hypothetical protein M885DRAFT_139860 [Pelagophyceae sp. CCMP2097]
MRVSAVMRLVLLDALRGARAFGGRGGRLARAPVAKRSARLSAVAAPGFDSWFKALPQGSTAALAKSGYAVAAPIQVCAWQETADGRGAARGESVAIHAPTGCGKTLAMVLPTLASTLWSGRGGKLLILVPTREIAQQHEQLVRCLLAEGAAACCARSRGDAERAGEADGASTYAVHRRSRVFHWRGFVWPMAEVERPVGHFEGICPVFYPV